MGKVKDSIALNRVLTVRRYCRDKKHSCVSCIFFAKDKGCLIGVPANWRLRDVKFGGDNEKVK